MNSINSVIGAMTPVVVVFIIGYIAAKVHDFDSAQAKVLNKLVMNYALPLTLFVGTIQTSKEVISADVGLTLSFVFVFGILYFLTLFFCRYILKLTLSLSAIAALMAVVPGVPFIGPSVLKFFFGAESGIAVSISSLVINVIVVPSTIILLTIATDQQKERSVSDPKVLRKQIASSLKEPVVWLPLMGLLMVLLDIKTPAIMESSLALLGVSTGGVSLFASGVILAGYPIRINTFVISTVLFKNLIQPAIIFGALVALNVDKSTLNEAVITTAIPGVSLAVMIAMRFDTQQGNAASASFFSTIFSILTMWIFVRLLGI